MPPSYTRDIESALDGALAKTRTPHASYLASTPLERRLLNQTFFKRILVGEGGEIQSAELRPIYAALTTWEPALGQIQARPATKGAEGSRNANPDPDFQGQGSHNAILVELEGLEPSTSRLPAGRSPN
jgi:hypothetical protein